MVGYNDAYNRALTAKSNALQRRKGQMIDRLNGSGRGDEDEDDYLSEEYMEGAGAYEDDYEDEMVGGSFEEASREVGGAMTFGGRQTGGFNSVGGRPTGGRLTGGFLPMFLAAAAAPLVGSLIQKLSGGAYTGGARKVKSDMMKDLMGMGADERLRPAFPIFTDMAYRVGNKAMKKVQGSGMAYGGAYGVTGGRATGGNPLLIPIAMAAAPALGRAFGKLFGLGRNDPIMRGSGFFDDLWGKIKGIPGDIARVVTPVATTLAPYIKQGAVWAKDNLLPIVADAAKDALKQKLTPAKPAAGKGMAVGVGKKMSPYDLAYGGARCCVSCKGCRCNGGAMAYGGAMRAQDLFKSENKILQQQVRGLKSAERRDKEQRYALGAGGKRLYMQGGVGGQLAPMGQESMFGYDNDEQPSGLVPPRNVATKGYMNGCGAMPMYSCGGRALTPVAQMKGVIGGRATGGSAWIQHVKAYAAKHGVSYKDALKSARATYRS